jgi:hypothetical protein
LQRLAIWNFCHKGQFGCGADKLASEKVLSADLRRKKMQKSRLRWLGIRSSLVFVLFIFVAIPVTAQFSTGTILGVVKDSTGGTVAGAAVTVTNPDTNLSRAGKTGDDGAYRFPALPVGNYEIKVTKDGFSTAERKGIHLQVAQEASIDFTLQVGSTGQTVVVTEEAPLVNTTSSTVGSLVQEEKVADLPLNGRNWTDLTLLQPGIAQSFNANTVNTFGTGGSFYSSNGAPIHSNNYLLDGAIMQNLIAFNNASIAGTTLGVDGIKEYKVVTSNFSAEYGITMGSQSTIVSKGGTNQFHGDAFDYLRNSSLDAANLFDKEDRRATVNGQPNPFLNTSAVFPGKRLPPFQRNNFGGAVGGPIKRDKTFFYVVYEGLRENFGATIADTTLPAACYTPGPNGTLTNVILNPVPTACSGAAAPITVTNPGILALMNAQLFPAPLPSLAGQSFNYSFPYIQPTHENYGQVRIDQNFSASDSFFARYTHDDADKIGNQAYPQVVTNFHSASQLATLGETYILSPVLLNTARLSFSRTVYANTTGVVPGYPAIPSLVAGSHPGVVTPALTVTGFSVQPVDPAFNAQDIFTLTDDIFWTKGKHAFKFGALWNRWQEFETINAFVPGVATFQTLPNFFIGNYLSLTWEDLTHNQSRTYVFNTIGFYLQDDYRLTPRLNLNLGMRYEFNTIPKEITGHSASIRDYTTAIGPNYGTVGPIFANNPTLHDISPRLGFAWDVFGNGKTSLRGAAGIYYDHGNIGAVLVDNALATPPFALYYIVNNAAATPPFPFQLPLDPLNVAAGSAATRGVAYHVNQPTLAQWNLTLDRQLPWNMALTVGYIGSRGWHLYQLRDFNPQIATGHDSNGLPFFCTPASGSGVPSATNPCLTTASSPTVRVNSAVTQPAGSFTLGQSIISDTSSESWYDSLQVAVNKQISKGLQFQSSYTWGKILDDGQAQYPPDASQSTVTVGNPGNVDKGVPILNIAQNWRFNTLYTIPNIHSNRIWAEPLHGWRVGGIVSVQTGYALTPLISTLRSLQNSSNTLAERPSIASNYSIGGVTSCASCKTAQQWYDPTMFAAQPVGTLGNAPKGSIIGPPLRNIDFSVTKDTKVRLLGEQGSVQFRAEMFNVFNHPNLGTPNLTVAAAAQTAGAVCGGQIGASTPCTVNGVTTTQTFPANASANGTLPSITSTANKSRQIQLALKIIF